MHGKKEGENSSRIYGHLESSYCMISIKLPVLLNWFEFSPKISTNRPGSCQVLQSYVCNFIALKF